MDKTAAICSFDRDMLFLFSERCVERLTGRTPFADAASVTTTYLYENVSKEAEKDRLFIERAAEAFPAGTSLAEADVEALYERSKKIDQVFVRHIVLPSLTINIRYDDIEDIRKRRIRFLIGVVGDLLQAWQDDHTFEETIRRQYTASQFQGLVSDILFLNCVEMKLLASSFTFLPPFNRAMGMFIDELVEVMEDAKKEVAAQMAVGIFDRDRRTGRWGK